MTDYALSSGIRIGDATIQSLDDCLKKVDRGEVIDVTLAMKLHQSLAEAIKPSIPRGINFMDDDPERPVQKYADPKKLISRLLNTAVGSLALLIVASLFPDVTPETLGTDFTYLAGAQQFANTVFLLAAAGIGAAFYNLFKAYSFMVEGTYDPQYASSYWIRFWLGILAGYMLAQLIPLPTDSGIGKPLLAILGGFSANAVNWILNRFVETLKTLVQGDMSAVVKAQEIEIEARLAQKQLRQNTEVARELMKAKLYLSESGAPDDVTKKLDELFNKITQG